MKSSTKFAILVTMAVALIAPKANATIISFSKITNNGPIDVAGQLSVDITSPAVGEVLFKFMNAGPVDCFIGQIYFDDNNTRLSNMVVNTNPETTAGVSFHIGATPGNLPAGNSISPTFSAELSDGADNPAPHNGVNPTEMLGIKFSGSLSDVLGDIANGALRLGLHVQGIGATGNSDSFVSVPEPSCGVLAVITLAMAFRVRNRNA